MTAMIQKARTTPWLAPVAAGALAAILLFVPISYDRQTGYRVTLALDAAGLPEAQVSKIATELQKSVHASNLNVNQSGDRVELTANVPMDQAAGVAGVARAFAAELRSRHISADATVSPVVTKVQGNVYAMAMSRVININVDTNGKTDAQVAEDIKAQLHAAGMDASSVEYTTDGDNHTLKIINENHDPNAQATHEEMPDVNLTVNGKSPAAEGGHEVRLKLEKQPGDTDETIRQRVIDQLRAQGVEANVEVKDGKITKLEPIRHN